LRKATIIISSCMSVCLSLRMEQLGSTGRIFLNFDMWLFFETPSRKLKFHWNTTLSTGIRDFGLPPRSSWELRCSDSYRSEYHYTLRNNPKQRSSQYNRYFTWRRVYSNDNTEWSKSLCAPDDYNTESYLAESNCLAADRQGQEDTRLTLTLSVIPNSNYVIMVSDWNCLKYFCMFLIL
jgi:hypothetical protein